MLPCQPAIIDLGDALTKSGSDEVRRDIISQRHGLRLRSNDHQA